MYEDSQSKSEPTLRDLPLQGGDRVAVFHDGAAHRGVVVGGIDGVTVDVTLVKGGDILTFPRAEVLPLYRYVQTEHGPAVFPLFYLKSGRDSI